MSRGSRFIAMIVLSLVMPAVAYAGDVPIQKGWPIARARKALFAEGWKPVLSSQRLADGTLTSHWGDAGVMWDAGFHEVEDCSEGLVYCMFNYSKAGHCLQLITQGELDDPRIEPRVTGWSEACPRHGTGSS